MEALTARRVRYAKNVCLLPMQYVVPGAAVAATALITLARARSQSDRFDAIVVGGGLAGMVAALRLLDRGGRVLIIEREEQLGGKAGYAGAGFRTPNWMA